MPKEHPPIIYWVRRDLRVSDNPALSTASAPGFPGIPVYFTSSWKEHHSWTGAKRQQFLCGCLDSLAKNIESLDGRLIIRHQDPIEGLKLLIHETKAQAVHFQQDPNPHGKQVERRLEALCESLGIPCHGHHEVSIHTPDEVLTQSGQPYRVYTPLQPQLAPTRKNYADR